MDSDRCIGTDSLKPSISLPGRLQSFPAIGAKDDSKNEWQQVFFEPAESDNGTYAINPDFSIFGHLPVEF
jgi:hypothetical protein